MSGDVVARARELMRDVEGYGDWILEPNEDSNGAYHVHSSSGSCIAEFSDRGDARFAANARMLVPELIEELELQTSLQGLSVQIPEYGEWGSETLLCLFQDFGIQPGDGYQAASARQGDLLRSLAAANAEVEKLRRGGKELGRIIERQSRDVLNITGLHHLIGPDGDGDWGVVWERLAEMAAAGAEVEKLRGALETIRTKAAGAIDPTGMSRSWALQDILAVIERTGIEP